MKFSLFSLIINCVKSLQFGLLVTKPIINKPTFGIKPLLHYGIIIDDNVIYEFNNNISRNVSFSEFGKFEVIDTPPKEGWEDRYKHIASNPPNYNVLTCNCEHIARWIRDDEYYCTQLPSYRIRKLFRKNQTKTSK